MQLTVEIITIIGIVLIGVIFAVYLIILKKNGWLGGNSDFYRCPNKECKGIFQKPIELKDLSATPARIYPACPECGEDLDSFFGPQAKKASQTKAKPLSSPTTPEIKPIKKKAEIKTLKMTAKTITQRSNRAKMAQAEKLEASGKKAPVLGDYQCQYYFGYLADRENQEEIPDPCLECPRSLDCMLTNYKSENTVTEIGKWYPVTA